MLYRIHRIKENAREHFRWAAHTGGMAVVKPKDYEANGQIEANSAYGAWKALSDQGDPLRTGDLLEEITSDAAPGTLHIAKYVGFEKATWFIPDPKVEIPTISTNDVHS